MPVWQALLFLVIGIALLYYGAEFLVKGGVSIALKLGVPSLVIGLTLVAAATSAPELVVSLHAAWIGNGGISAGNIIGSNICNVGLILGLSALLNPLIVHRQLLIFDLPALAAATLLFAGMGLTFGEMGRVSGALFVLLLAAYVAMQFYFAKKNGGDTGEIDEIARKPVLWAAALLLVLGGLVMLIAGAKLMVEGALEFGHRFGVSDAVLGLTVVAIGTSLPELATSVVAALKKEQDIAIGNVVGSNIFNILAIMGITPLVRPVSTGGILPLDWGMMAGLTVLLFPIMLTGRKISRKEGALLLLLFIAYLTVLVVKTAAKA